MLLRGDVNMSTNDLKQIIIEKLLKISEIENIPEDIENRNNIIKDNYTLNEDKKEDEFYWNLSSIQIIELIIELENELDIEFDMEKSVEFRDLNDLLGLIDDMLKEKEG